MSNDKLIQAAEKALDVLYDSVSSNKQWVTEREEVCAALRAALAEAKSAEQQGEQEPVHPFGYFFEGPEGLRMFAKATDYIKPVLDMHDKMAAENPNKFKHTPLFTHPQRDRVKAEPLTKERIRGIRLATEFRPDSHGCGKPWPSVADRYEAFARAIEADVRGIVQQEGE